MSNEERPDCGLNPDYGEDVQFGNAAADYSTYRATYPDELFERLDAFDVGREGQSVLDLGTGTGFLARPLVRRGCTVVGCDVDRELLVEGRTASSSSNGPAYVRARAEHCPFDDDAFDVVTAGQCWHWFDRERATREVRRVLVPGGRLVITHFDWLPVGDNVVAATEDLICEWSPDWPAAGGNGFYPEWAGDVSAGGFENLETFTFDVDVPYTHEAWRGRIRASAGVGGSLPPNEVRAFDDAHAELLTERFPDEPLDVPHRSFTLVCELPS